MNTCNGVEVKLSTQDRLRWTKVRARAIGRELRRRYDPIVAKPVPDDMLNMLRKIDERQRA